MKKAIVNLNDCKYFDEVFKRFAEALHFPEWYGKNLDAFWDLINMDCDVNFVTIIGSGHIREELKPLVKSLIELLEENKQYWENSDCPFDYEIID